MKARVQTAANTVELSLLTLVEVARRIRWSVNLSKNSQERSVPSTEALKKVRFGQMMVSHITSKYHLLLIQARYLKSISAFDSMYARATTKSWT
mmetsp:Transcript_13252/g.46355  ORF Transcript_13252/g.46355 Transcript_13252/m.46355 type:complete len:94 (+) Transcript_13252:108-389(+)